MYVRWIRNPSELAELGSIHMVACYLAIKVKWIRCVLALLKRKKREKLREKSPRRTLNKHPATRFNTFLSPSAYTQISRSARGLFSRWSMKRVFASAWCALNTHSCTADSQPTHLKSPLHFHFRELHWRAETTYLNYCYQQKVFIA